MTRMFQVAIDPPHNGGMSDFHDLLLRHPRIRDAFSEMAFLYWVKFDGAAGDLAALVGAVLPENECFVAELHPQKIAGKISSRALEWFERPPPPPRHDGHQPDAAALARLPPIEAVEPSITEARIAALIGAKTQGAA